VSAAAQRRYQAKQLHDVASGGDRSMPVNRSPKGTDAMPAPAPLRPSDTCTFPDDVTDRLLYTLAVDVAAAHQPGPDGTCGNPQCRHQSCPCEPLRNAYRAATAARRQPVREHPIPHQPARGRARVAPPAMPRVSRVAAALDARPVAPVDQAAGPRPVARPFVVYRRPLAAASAA
jgi:hypothetical protein